MGGPTETHLHRAPQRPWVAPYKVLLLKHRLVKGLPLWDKKANALYQSRLPKLLKSFTGHLHFTRIDALSAHMAVNKLNRCASLTSLNCNEMYLLCLMGLYS